MIANFLDVLLEFVGSSPMEGIGVLLFEHVNLIHQYSYIVCLLFENVMNRLNRFSLRHFQALD
jgi:hypothetical protein